VLSRNLFEEIAEDKDKKYGVFLLDEGHCMLPELYCFNSQFYGDSFKAHRSNGGIERSLQNIAEEYWKQLVRPSFQGPIRQVAIDVTGEYDGEPIQHEQLSRTTTRVNPAEAAIIAWLIKDMLLYVPPETKASHRYRRF
jgi:hypothetical protein